MINNKHATCLITDTQVTDWTYKTTLGYDVIRQIMNEYMGGKKGHFQYVRMTIGEKARFYYCKSIMTTK